MPRQREAPFFGRVRKHLLRLGAKPRENLPASPDEFVARPQGRVATADRRSIAPPALLVPRPTVARPDNRKAYQDSFDVAGSVMLDVAACNRELRDRVADRLELGLLRQFGGVGSQSDNLIHFWIQGDGKAWSGMRQLIACVHQTGLHSFPGWRESHPT